ncbi:hypothetical protein [Atribacter laminatus]|uniref:Uncharacterized protein n=1 Tax=Atribacter laminatus TaxID=2847778 RepID=A0A7T1F225_ATRLM|nr:hypothetical protein [Atribacter laminatus]QPM66871.1 hypothetical protein RT761_00057 [Atribacter laminatus]
MILKHLITIAFVVFIMTIIICLGTIASAEVRQEVLDSISTPNRVETSIGTLEFLDGAPSQETAQKVYDFLDTMRGVDTFLKGMPGASVGAMIKGIHEVGAVEAHQVLIFDKLLDSPPCF